MSQRSRESGIEIRGSWAYNAPVKVKPQGGARGDPGGLDVYIQSVGEELDLTWQPGGAGIRQIVFLWQKLNKGEHPPKKPTFEEKRDFCFKLKKNI